MARSCGVSRRAQVGTASLRSSSLRGRLLSTPGFLSTIVLTGGTGGKFAFPCTPVWAVWTRGLWLQRRRDREAG